MSKFLNITGQRFGRLVVLERQGVNRHRKVLWFAQCDCGKTIVVRTNSLVSGNTRSCGCLQRDVAVANATTHGQADTPTYRAWQTMHDRCGNPKNKQYPRYGGRGIGIDDPRWFSFQNFFDEMGKKPPGCDLHRVENDKGYSKANCVWLPHSEHMRLHLKERHARQRARLDLEPRVLGCSRIKTIETEPLFGSDCQSGPMTEPPRTN